MFNVIAILGFPMSNQVMVKNRILDMDSTGMNNNQRDMDNNKRMA